ncbi:uncharacterized protein LOC110979024 [Acanthaster planci]|uniref:Uncharacterized protein LOC110979024 n=1 Tax=Acanthaster planci TaxID=133434 RepID=A0A8B7YA83_ACAPL|nr:uncharacterized protein LOC110979024 [Acanthaster planci]
MFRFTAILLVLGMVAIQASRARPETRRYETNLKDSLKRREDLDLVNQLLERLLASEEKREVQKDCPEATICSIGECYYVTDTPPGYGLVLYNRNSDKLLFQFDEDTLRRLDDKKTNVTVALLSTYFPYTSEDFEVDGETYNVKVDNVTVDDEGNITVDGFCLVLKEEWSRQVNWIRGLFGFKN